LGKAWMDKAKEPLMRAMILGLAQETM